LPDKIFAEGAKHVPNINRREHVNADEAMIVAMAKIKKKLSFMTAQS